MNEFDLEHYRKAWQAAPFPGDRPLAPGDIGAVLTRESRNVTRQFRVALLTDLALKGAATVALAGLVYLYRGNAAAAWLNVAVLGFTLFLAFLQWKTLNEIPGADLAGASLRDALRGMVDFYREKFTRALYVAAVSGSLVFYTGVLYYSAFRYGGLRPLQADDYAVFITGLLLAFAINATAQRWQAGFHVRELERCLQDIDAESLTEQRLRKYRHRRVRLVLLWAVSAALGMLLLAWFIVR